MPVVSCAEAMLAVTRTMLVKVNRSQRKTVMVLFVLDFNPVFISIFPLACRLKTHSGTKMISHGVYQIGEV
jgi:hypothetical protein